MKHYPYDVILNGEAIDTVFYSGSENPDDVKKSLVNHDGYDPAIVVYDRTSREFSTR